MKRYKLFYSQTLSSCSIYRYLSIANVVEHLLHSTVDKFTRHVFLQQDKFITQSRRSITPIRSSPWNLAQRLARQRHIRQFLIPTSVTIDKSRQYIQFTWPTAGLQALNNIHSFTAKEENEEEEEGNIKQQQQQQQKVQIANSMTNNQLCQKRISEVKQSAQPQQLSNTINASKQFLLQQKLQKQQQQLFSSNKKSMTSNSSSLCATSNKSDKHTQIALPQRTRALAQYLRAYTTSSDGTLASQQLIYGRRGITIKDVIPVGNYALRIAFSDGHDGGIYTYEYLYALTLHDGSKFHYMRKYIQSLRKARKSRDPPKRSPSTRRRLSQSINTQQ